MATTNNHSRLFEGYKSIGLVSSIVPHLVRYIEKLNKIQIVTAVGRSFLVFNERLQLVETCVAHSTDINVLAANERFLFTAADREIFAWKYGHKWKVKSYQGCQSTITHLLVFGARLIGLDRSNTLYSWDITSEELLFRIEFGGSNKDNEECHFEITALCHPATHRDRLLFGSVQGTLQLWNLTQQKMVDKFRGWGSKVTTLEQAPLVHLIGVGHESGLIVLHHLLQNVTLMKLCCNEKSWGPISSITFRTDDNAKMAPFLVSTSGLVGSLAVWNLEKQTLAAEMKDIHGSGIVRASFVSREPLLVTNSPDNSLKIFVFDDIESTGRLLFQREGHRQPPTKIKFYGPRGAYIVSAGLDSSLRAFSIYSERLNRNLGTASFNRKLSKKKGVHRDRSNVLSPIVDFSLGTTREKEWDNIVACHRDLGFVTSWSFDRMKMGQHKMIREHSSPEEVGGQMMIVAESVCLSACGNFAIVGYRSGHLDRFNIQSGIHRCSYTCEDHGVGVGGKDHGVGGRDHGVGKDGRAHSGTIRSVVTDQLNQLIISGGSDQRLRFWRFSRNQLIGTLKLSGPVAELRLHPESNLLAVAQDNYAVVIVDIETKRIVRRFGSGVHRSRITDLTFDNDCRRLFVASMDSVIYCYDLVTGLLVDLFRTSTPCVGLSFSPTGEFLATCHVGDLAIYLWANLSIYTTVSLKPIEVDDVDDNMRIELLELPQIQIDSEDDADVQEDAEDHNDGVGTTYQNDEDLIDYQYVSPEQISKDLITLSNLPQSRWKNLLNLDLIRRRNKPIEPVQKPKSVPFFLPTISGLKNTQFNLDQIKDQHTSIEDTQITEKKKFNVLFMSELMQLLHRCSSSSSAAENNGDYSQFWYQFRQLGPSKIDAELRTIGPDSTGSIETMLMFCDAIEWILATNLHYELAQSYLGLFLKIYTETVAEHPPLLERLQRIAKISEERWQRIGAQFDRSLCLVNFMRNALL